MLAATAAILVVVFVVLTFRLLTHLAAFIRKPGIASTVNVICTGAFILLASYGLDAAVEKLKHLL